MNGMEHDAHSHDASLSKETDQQPTPDTKASDSAVLGPVAAKGPKRFSAMPDLSKIPPGARERLARFAQDGPAWGNSSTDARSLSTSSNPDEVALDLGPLGDPTPIIASGSGFQNDALQRDSFDEPPTDSVQPQITASGEGFATPGSVDAGQDFEQDEVDPEFGSFNDATFGQNADIGPLFGDQDTALVSLTPQQEDTESPSALVVQAPEQSIGSQLYVTPIPESLHSAQITPEVQQDKESASGSLNTQEFWNDDIPLPDEPDFYWDEGPIGADPFAATSNLASQPLEQKDVEVSNTSDVVRTRTAVDSDLSSNSNAQLQPSTDLEGTVRALAESHLRKLVGRNDVSLREDQWTAIKALVMDHSRALVVQRTGWGKSAVYFVSTALLRAQGHGPTVIISPLLALMRDQVSAAERAGIKAVTINSSNVTEWDHIQAQIAAGEVDVLLCSPERLNNPAFRDEVLPRLARDAGLVVVDEAHCISDWGHDFRPDYRRIRTLLQELRAGIPVLATTATANERVSEDIAEQLSVTADGSMDNVVVLRGALDRESLHLAVVHLEDTAHRVAWIMDALRNLIGSGIVYCMTVSAAQEVTEQLRAAGLDVAAYTGRTDTDERAMLEQQLKDNKVKALIATSALGMGFDKPDLSFVIHLGAPNSPIAYYQQVGRAGRGIAQASSVLLPGKEDREIWEYFGSLAFPSEPQVREVLSLLDAAGSNGMGPVSVPQLESKVDLKRSRLEMMLKVLDVDGAVKRVQRGWISTGQPWRYDKDRYQRVEAARVAEQNAMLLYSASTECRIEFLRRALDDPDLASDYRCGRCDNCGGIQLPTTASPESLSVTNISMAQPGIEVPARKMWPTNMAALGLELSGKLKINEIAQDGRAVSRIDGLGWSNDLRELFSPKAPDGPTPLRLRTAAVEVLNDWSQVRQVEGVVSIRSLKRPELVDHLAQGLAQYLGKPYVGTIGPLQDMPAARHDVNSAMRLAGVAKRLQLELPPASKQGLPGRSILLVDDYTESGWTLTVAAQLLRQAGASNVYPFVLAQF